MAVKKREELLGLIPAYAIGALDESERDELESWLRSDLEAQGILADYQVVANHLVVLASLRPMPAHLQDDLRQRLATDRGGDRAAVPIEKSPGQAWRSSRRAAWILAVAALFAVVILGVLLVQSDSTDGSDLTTPDAGKLYAQLAARSDSKQYMVVAGEVDDAVSGSLIISPDGEQAVLRISYLPQITEDQIFQMWLIDESGARTSGGLFHANVSQDTLYIQIPFDRPIMAYRGVGVSLEPAGGSPYEDRPTGPRVLSVPLS